MNSKTKRANNQVNSVMNVQEQREMVEKANRILSEMKSFTWRDLETQGKFSKNDKLSLLSRILSTFRSCYIQWKVINPHFKWGFNFYSSAALCWFRPLGGFHRYHSCWLPPFRRPLILRVYHFLPGFEYIPESFPRSHCRLL